MDNYLYKCYECGERVYDSRKDLEMCPHCNHHLSKPTKLEDIAFAGRGTARVPRIMID